MASTHTKDATFSPQDSHINEYEDVDPVRANFSREMLEKKRTDLKRLAVRNYERKRFISLPSMQKCWTEKGHQLDTFLADVGCAISSDKLELIRTTSLRILTALVLTKWHATNAVGNFRATFRKIFPNEMNPQWNDDFLLGPDGLPKLELPHLSQDEETSLENAIFEVSVPVLQKSKDRKPYSETITLPITSRELIGEGAYGKVYKVKIAAGCVLIENKAADRSEENKVWQLI